MPKCSICFDEFDDKTVVETTCCHYVVCKDCLASSGSLVRENWSDRIKKCAGCGKPITFGDLGKAHALVQKDWYLPIVPKAEERIVASDTSPQEITMNAWCFQFRCPQCGNFVGYSGEKCDTLTCTFCRKQFNPAKGKEGHSGFLEKLYRALSSVREDENTNALQWFIERQPVAARACRLPELLKVVNNEDSEINFDNAYRHVIPIVPEFTGLMDHLKRLRSKNFQAPSSSSSNVFHVPSVPAKNVFQGPPAAAANPPTLPVPSSSSAPSGPTWLCKHCHRESTHRFKCSVCQRPMF